MQTRISKSNDGWKAQTDWPLGDDRILRVTTDRSYRGDLRTTARVHRIENGFLVFAMSLGAAGKGDFTRVLVSTNKRCTEKAVTEQQAGALVGIEAVIAEARAHYGLSAVEAA